MGKSMLVENPPANGSTLDCRHVLWREPGNGAAGYGRDDHGATFCYVCCADRDRAAMVASGRADLYLTNEPDRASDVAGARRHVVSNWPGSLKFPVERVRRSTSRGFGPWPIIRYDVWFRDHTGAAWWGVNKGDNQILRCRRVKG